MKRKVRAVLLLILSMKICQFVAPEYREVEEGHYCACHLYTPQEELDAFNAEQETAVAQDTQTETSAV